MFVIFFNLYNSTSASDICARSIMLLARLCSSCAYKNLNLNTKPLTMSSTHLKAFILGEQRDLV